LICLALCHEVQDLHFSRSQGDTISNRVILGTGEELASSQHGEDSNEKFNKIDNMREPGSSAHVSSIYLKA